MNKTIQSIWVLLLLLPVGAHAQFEEFGMKVGVQSSGIYSDPIDVDGRIVGVSVFAYSEWAITSWLSTNFEMGFTQKGFNTFQTITDEVGNILVEGKAYSRVDYLSLQSIARVNHTIGDVQTYFGIGPNFNYLIGRKPGTLTSNSFRHTDYTVDNFRDTTVGIALVAGIDDQIFSSLPFTVEARFTLDLTDSRNNHPRKIHNNSIGVFIGLDLLNSN